MIEIIKEKLLQNTNEIRYMYFGIVITVFIFIVYKYLSTIKEVKIDNLSKKEKVLKAINNKYIKMMFVVILPILLEAVLYNNIFIQFSKEVYIRIAYEYSFFAIIVLYKWLCKKSKKVNKILDFCVDNRYKIALVVFVVFVALKLNFSSIGMWDYYIRENVNFTIFGESRSIRSDEWLVTTPFNLSQSYDDFNRVNKNLDIGNNDMNIFHAPVLDFSIIVRIYNWGYILFGNEIGFSWMWCLKLISMFMIFFELGMILTKKDKAMSLMAAVWLTFSPAIMWWSMVDNMAFAMAIIVLFNMYVSNKNLSMKKKILIAFGMLIFLCNFAYSLYPAWQIPLAYFIIAFVIIDFIRYRKNLNKKDYVIMGITLILTIIFLGYFIITSWSGIQSMLNTKYPGGREELGGDYEFSRLTNYYTNFFTPYTDEYENPSDLASFIYPSFSLIIIFICYIINIFKGKNIIYKIKDKFCNKENWYIYGTITILTIFLLWMSFKWPSILAKITGLFTSPTKRIDLIFEFGCVILTIMIASKIFNRDKKILSRNASLIFAVIITITTFMVVTNSKYSETFTIFKLSILIPIIFVINYTLLSSNKRGFIYSMILISLFTGAYINPIEVGTKVITDTKIASAATEIANADPEAIWIGQGQLNSQYLVANGLKVLNGINEYPNYDWINKIDPEYKYEEVWNRYAHIIINLDYDTFFELNMTDAYTVHMTYSNLKDLNIKYYYTNEKADEKMVKDFNLELLYEDNEAIHYIYEIK